ncbi:phage tail protein [Streptomyces sp. N2-109]|uniref:Phage tail protein n=1 Tax=Streptomyces gossypii TaxID=2883101 RepID=A0ABT2K1B2_9ACTN|nr:phage tail protein [Streptomyces gossypii]MCT2593933.1 phage tail protein [Streptomyces gossypii]
MRAMVPGLPTAHPLLHQLPGVYHDGDFLRRFLEALDEVLAPLLLTLDNLPAHLRPETAPEDFLDWLAGWVAVEAGEELGVGQRRAVVADAVRRHRQRGTRRGLAEAVRVETGVEPEISESGATAWSSVAGVALPGSPEARVTIRLRVPDPEEYRRKRLGQLEKLVAAEVPAHVAHRIEILPTAEGARTL